MTARPFPPARFLPTLAAIVLLGYGRHALGQAIAYSPDGKAVATVNADIHDPSVSVRDAPTGGRKWSLDSGGLPRQTRIRNGTPLDWPWSVAVSPDARTVAVGGGSLYHGDVVILDAATGKLIRDFRDLGHHHELSVAYSPDGRSLYAACRDGTIKGLDVAVGGTRRSFEAQCATSVAVSPDGKVVAAMCLERAKPEDVTYEVRIWDAGTGVLVKSLPVATRPASTSVGVRAPVAFSAEGGTLAGAVEGTSLRLWDVRSGWTERALKGGDERGRVTSLAFTPDGQTLLAAVSGRVKAWDIRTGDVRKTPNVEADAIAVSPDGKALYGLRGGELGHWGMAKLMGEAGT